MHLLRGVLDFFLCSTLLCVWKTDFRGEGKCTNPLSRWFNFLQDDRVVSLLANRKVSGNKVKEESLHTTRQGRVT